MCTCPQGHADACPRVLRDQATVRLLQAQNEEGLTRLLTDHGGRVRGLLRRDFVGALDALQVDDAMNQAVQRVWRAAANIDLERGGLGAWFLVIARNCARRVCAQAMRARNASLDPEVAAPEPAADPQEQVPSGRAALLRQCIDELPPQQRAVLLADLAAGGTASAVELARQLGTTANSVYVSRSNGRRALREAIHRLGNPSAPVEEGGMS